MLLRKSCIPTLSAALLAMGLVVGCGQNQQTNLGGYTPHDAGDATDLHDVPLTEQEIAQLKKDTARYADAIDHIQQYQSTIQLETTSGEPAKAHRALDNLDVVLERLPAAARDSAVPKEKWQAVNETAQKLRDLFNQVHANIDAGEDPDYGAVAGEIDIGVSRLAAIKTE